MAKNKATVEMEDSPELFSVIEETETEMEVELELPSNRRLSATPRATPKLKTRVTLEKIAIRNSHDATPKFVKPKKSTPSSVVRRKGRTPRSSGKKKKVPASVKKIKASRKRTKTVTKTTKKTVTTRKITKKITITKVPLVVNDENKIVLKEKRFYAWGGEDGDQTVIDVLKKAGWTYCGEPVHNGREDYPHSMYDARDNGELDKGPALFWADDDDSKVLQGLSNDHLISSIPLAAKALTKSYQQIMFQDYKWFPKCFTIPKETDQLMNYITQNPDSYWICKPDDGYGGNGMCVYKAGSEAFNSVILKRKSTLAVQQYMSNPYLFAGLYKFHFRCYMVISNVKPLRAYLWKNCQIQFATHPFDLSKIESKFNKFCHITNYKVNNQKNNRKFVWEDKPGIGIGTEWSFERFANAMSEDKNFSSNKFWNDLRIIAKVVATKLVSSKWVEKSLKKTPFSTNHFEIYGLDILMDDQCNLAMTETNTTPGLDDTDPLMTYKNEKMMNPEAVKANEITHGIILDTLSLVLDTGRPLFSPFIPLHL